MIPTVMIVSDPLGFVNKNKCTVEAFCASDKIRKSFTLSMQLDCIGDRLGKCPKTLQSDANCHSLTAWVNTTQEVKRIGQTDRLGS